VSVKNKTIPISVGNELVNKLLNLKFHGVVPERLLTEISERPELLSEKIPVTIRKNYEKAR
jgi:type III secretion system FlhB-like substrate exporter